MVGCEGSVTKSVPLYSTDHRHAVRIYDYDAGAVGGDTGVYLYSHLGLWSEDIFEGNWKAAKDVRWINNHELLIKFEPSYGPPVCKDGSEVKVRCEPAVIVPK